MIEDDFPVIKLAPDNMKKINRERKKKKKINERTDWTGKDSVSLTIDV